MTWKEMVDEFNGGNSNILAYFNNDVDDFFEFVKSKGLLQYLDPENGENAEEWQNKYFLWLYDNDKKEYYNYLKKNLSDIKIDENGQTFWIGDRGDLARLFCDSRDISRDTIEEYLIGENIFEPFWETTDNVYRDVIEELDDKNMSRLKEYIVQTLAGQELSPETSEMELIASEQKHEDYWEMNSDVVTRIIDDEESMNSLLSDELSDLKSELYSIHNNSFNSAYEEDFYESIFSELGEFFGEKGTWITIPHPYKKDTTIEKFKLPILDLEGVVNDFLEQNKGYGGSGTLGYHGNFIEIIHESKDCLRLRVSDYPDYRKVDKNINSYFQDYI